MQLACVTPPARPRRLPCCLPPRLDPLPSSLVPPTRPAPPRNSARLNVPDPFNSTRASFANVTQDTPAARLRNVTMFVYEGDDIVSDHLKSAAPGWESEVGGGGGRVWLPPSACVVCSEQPVSPFTAPPSTQPVARGLGKRPVALCPHA
jgi:hypothetical protein